MDRFDSMRLFTRVVERRSFTAAAADLGLPRSSATAAIKQLEERLGVQLLRRTTRHVTTTLDGEAYYQRCIGILADIEDARAASARMRCVGASASTSTAIWRAPSCCRNCRCCSPDIRA